MMEDVPQQLRLSLYRKDYFKSANDKKNHASMREGFLKFMDTLRKSSTCAVMENGTVSALFARRPLPTTQDPPPPH